MEPTKILLVEDDPNDVELIQIALDSYNFVNNIDVVFRWGTGDSLSIWTRWATTDTAIAKISAFRLKAT